MSVMMARVKIREEHADEVEWAATRMFAALEEAAPQGVRYSSLRLEGGATYVVLLEIAEGAENPLFKIPEFLEFQQKLKGWIAEPSAPEQFKVVGSYRSF